MANQDQATHWNAAAGRNWVEMQPVLDRMFAGLLPPLLDAVAPGAGARILDIGCGAGALTLAAADRAGPSADCLGLDISEPLVAAARAEAGGIPNARFELADAQIHDFAPGGFDTVLSRFGVMFFDDPVAAFANIRRATRPGGALRFAAWRSPKDNPFMRVGRQAALPFVDLPLPDPEAPGQFAFADRERVQSILSASGWRDIAIEPLDVPCSISVRDLPTYTTRLGPLGPLWAEFPPDLQSRLAEALREAFDVFVTGDEAVFTAGCWLVAAKS